MSDVKLAATTKLYPSVEGLFAYYDHEYIGSYYSISSTETGQAFFNRMFLKEICNILNDQKTQQFIRGLRLSVHFDKCDRVVTCRFELPYDHCLKKAAMAFLYEIVDNQELRSWIDKIIFDSRYFVIYGCAIN